MTMSFEGHLAKAVGIDPALVKAGSVKIEPWHGDGLIISAEVGVLLGAEGVTQALLNARAGYALDQETKRNAARAEAEQRIAAAEAADQEPTEE